MQSWRCFTLPFTTVIVPAKVLDWDALGRLHEKGLIDNPVGKTKSVAFTQEGLTRSKELFEKMFKT